MVKKKTTNELKNMTEADLLHACTTGKQCELGIYSRGQTTLEL